MLLNLAVIIKSLLAQFAYGWQPPQIDHPFQCAGSILTRLDFDLDSEINAALFMASRKALTGGPDSKYEGGAYDRS
jgi:hypothetical protein